MALVSQTSDITIKKTRKGKIIRRIREHYLRNDIGCGSQRCTICIKFPLTTSPLDYGADTYYIVDTNVIFTHLPLLKHHKLTHLIFLQTSLNEVRSFDGHLYQQIREITKDISKHCYVFNNEYHYLTYTERLKDHDSIESIHQRNDRAIFQSFNYYQQHIGHLVNILWICVDDNRYEYVTQQGIQAITLSQLVNLPEFQGLDEFQHYLKPSVIHDKNDTFYPAHLSIDKVNIMIQEGQAFISDLRINRRYPFEGKVRLPTGFIIPEQYHIHSSVVEVVIKGSPALNRAMDGDTVSVCLDSTEPYTIDNEEEILIKKEEEEAENDYGESLPLKKTSNSQSQNTKTLYGRVISIISRKWRPLVAYIDEETNQLSGNILVIPVKENYPRVRVFCNNISRLVGYYLLIHLDCWDRQSRYPLGHIVEIIGQIGILTIESKVILLEHQIRDNAWSDDVLRCLPSLPINLSLSDNHSKNEKCPDRIDMRHIHIISIDPQGCTDIDDAIHAVKQPDGLYEVGVHIADVSSFIKVGSALDKEAMLRATSVYLVERRIDMLPSLLSTNICSLVEHQDRYAFSVIWKIDNQANIHSTSFHKTLICLSQNYSYEQAQSMMDSQYSDAFNSQSFEAIKILQNLTAILRKRRKDKGALTLASLQMKFANAPQDDVLDEMILYPITPSHHMVEELMLLANVSVAKHLLSHFPQDALLRRHPIPSESQFSSLVNSTKSVGINLSISNSYDLNQSLEKISNPDLQLVLRVLATRCMTQAVYCLASQYNPVQFYHYGLAVPVYTHFTSPIRRYPDIIVHRLLSYSLGYEQMDQQQWYDNHTLELMVQNMNERHYQGQLSGRESSNLHKMMLLERYIQQQKENQQKSSLSDRSSSSSSCTDRALIIGFRSHQLRVLSLTFGIEENIQLSSTSVYDETSNIMTEGTKTFHLFQEILIEVEIEIKKFGRKKIKLNLIFNQQKKKKSKKS